jgi:hypothetical protein
LSVKLLTALERVKIVSTLVRTANQDFRQAFAQRLGVGQDAVTRDFTRERPAYSAGFALPAECGVWQTTKAIYSARHVVCHSDVYN